MPGGSLPMTCVEHLARVPKSAGGGCFLQSSVGPALVQRAPLAPSVISLQKAHRNTLEVPPPFVKT
jgi:hypothetical protein